MSDAMMDVLIGFSMIADIYLPKDLSAIETISNTLLGFNEAPIKAAMKYRAQDILKETDGSRPINLDEVVQGQYDRLVDRCRSFIRTSAQLMTNRVASDTAHRHREDRLKRMRSLAAQHPAGTTAEIAALLNTSKTKVRQYKADGTLTSMIELAKAEKESIEN